MASRWPMALPLTLGACGGGNPCDLLTVEAAFVALEEGGYSCTADAPCLGEIRVTLRYEDVEQEPTMVVVVPVALGAERTVAITQSVHESMLGERDSFPVRDIEMTLQVPGGSLEYPTVTVEDGDIRVVEEPQEYEACNAQDEERLIYTFDATQATFVAAGDTDT